MNSEDDAEARCIIDVSTRRYYVINKIQAQFQVFSQDFWFDIKRIWHFNLTLRKFIESESLANSK